MTKVLFLNYLKYFEIFVFISYYSYISFVKNNLINKRETDFGFI